MPKANFPEGLPQSIAQAVVDDEQLRHAQAISGTNDMDLSDVYLIDGVIPRSSLGLGVRTVRFFAGKRSRAELPPEQAATGPKALLAGEAPITGVPATGGGGPATGGGEPAAVGGPATGGTRAKDGGPATGGCNAGSASERALKRNVSEGSEPYEDPVTKRRRKLQETMGSLRVSITEAAREGRWHSESQWAVDTVIFLTEELLQLVRTLLTEDLPGWQPQAPFPESGAGPHLKHLVNKIQRFFSTLLLTNPMYAYLKHFKTVFETLKGFGASDSGDVALLEILMSNLGQSATWLTWLQFATQRVAPCDARAIPGRFQGHAAGGREGVRIAIQTVPTTRLGPKVSPIILS